MISFARFTLFCCVLSQAICLVLSQGAVSPSVISRNRCGNTEVADIIQWSQDAGDYPAAFNYLGRHGGFASVNIGDINGDFIDDIAVSGGGSGGYGRIVLNIMSEDGVDLDYPFPKDEIVIDQYHTALNYAVSIGHSGANPLLRANTMYQQFGISLANMGDMSGNGISELAVGAPWSLDSGPTVDTGAGAVILLFLNDGTVVDQAFDNAVRISCEGSGSGLDCSTCSQSVCQSSDDWFGYAVTNVGDLDGNGVTDIMIGAPHSAGEATTGMPDGFVMTVFLDGFGNPTITVLGNQRLAPQGEGFGGSSDTGLLDSGSMFGTSLANMGDFNGDFVTDVAIGAPGANFGQGAVFIACLDNSGMAIDLFKLTAADVGLVDHPSPMFGFRVSTAGDLNTDGVLDLVATSLGQITCTTCYVSSDPNFWGTAYYGDVFQYIYVMDYGLSATNADLYAGSAIHIMMLNADGTIHHHRDQDITDLPHTIGSINAIFGFSVSNIGTRFGGELYMAVGIPLEKDNQNGLVYLMPLTDCDCSTTAKTGVECDKACKNGGVNLDNDKSLCQCAADYYTGATCNKICDNGGVADEEQNVCNCTLAGATGTYCTDDIDDCASSPCQNSGFCTDRGNRNYSCACTLPYYGDHCELELCNPNPCMNMAECLVDIIETSTGALLSAEICNCSGTGYTGDFCQTDLDDCLSSPCENGATCSTVFGAKNYSCTCESGYTGPKCSDDIDDCASSPCQNLGVCKDKGQDTFDCTCATGWEGDLCEIDHDDCVERGYECLNGGDCYDNPLLLGEITCECANAIGFTGTYCEISIASACDTDNPCLNGGQCSVEPTTNEIICDCENTGYTGRFCGNFSYVDECTEIQCQNGGTCIDPAALTDDWYCLCDVGFSGELCETPDVDFCTSSPCLNNGTCVAENSTCICHADLVPYEENSFEFDEFCNIDLFALASSSSSEIFGNKDEIWDENADILIICNNSSASRDSLFILFAGCCVLLVCIWLMLRKFPMCQKRLNPTPTVRQRFFFLSMFLFSFLNIVSDILFFDLISSCQPVEPGATDIFATLVGAVLGVGAIVNMLGFLWIINRDEEKYFQTHMAKYPIASSMAVLIAATNLSGILILDSNIFGFPALTGKWSPKYKRKIKLFALMSNLIQNLPQLSTQVSYILSTGSASHLVAIGSVTLGGVMLVVAAIRAVMISCELMGKEKKVHKDVEQGQEYQVPK